MGEKQDMNRAIGQRVKHYRELAGLSQAELGRRIGFRSASAIFYLESGQRAMKVFDLMAIAREVGTTFLRLATGEEATSGRLPCADVPLNVQSSDDGTTSWNTPGAVHA